MGGLSSVAAGAHSASAASRLATLYERNRDGATLALRDSSVIGIGLLDLYGPTFYPSHVSDRYAWAKKKFEDDVGSDRFVQHFAVHETEAWVFADPSVLPPEIRSAIPGKASNPETINFDEPPSKLLACLIETGSEGAIRS